MRKEIFEELVIDLADNFRNDDNVLGDMLDDAIVDALSLSNRPRNEANLLLLKSNIKKCVKSNYLLRGSEDTSSSSLPGYSGTSADTIGEMRNDIVRQGKRLLP